MKLTKSEYWKAIGYLKKAHQVWKSFSPEKKETEKSTYYHINFLHGKALMLIPNHNDEATQLFKQALIFKDDFDCRYNLAKALYYGGQYDQAKQALPDEQKYYVVELSAYIEYKLGNCKEALSIVLKLLQRRPKDYLFCFAANIKLETGSYREAYQYAKKAVKVNEKNHKNYYMMAQVYFKLGLLNKAIKAIDEAESLKEKRYNSSYNECEDLRKQIVLLITPDYVEDAQLADSLEDTKSSSCTGTIVQYNDSRGFGFVFINDQRIFVHVSKVKTENCLRAPKYNSKLKQQKKGSKLLTLIL